MHRVVITIAVLASMLGGSPAGASPQSDFDAVYGDWKPDLEITACRWSQAQLQNAYDVAQGNPDFQYETAFVDATKAEIDRWKNGGCAGVKPLSARQKSKLFGVKIVSVNGKGKPTSEVVKMRNAARRTISFRKARLRNSKSGAAVFPASFKLRKGRTATVHLGCAKGKRRASFNGATVWLCRRKQLFRDKGDLARLSDAKGIVVSQSGFGSLKRRPAF